MLQLFRSCFCYVALTSVVFGQELGFSQDENTNRTGAVFITHVLETDEIKIQWKKDATTVSQEAENAQHFFLWPKPGQPEASWVMHVVSWEGGQFKVDDFVWNFKVRLTDTPQPINPNPVIPNPVNPNPVVPVPINPVLDPPGALAAILPPNVDRLVLAEFYRDFAVVIRSADAITTTEQFREAHKLATKTLQDVKKLPTGLTVLNASISARLKSVIGDDIATITPTMREALAKELTSIGDDF